MGCLPRGSFDPWFCYSDVVRASQDARKALAPALMVQDILDTFALQLTGSVNAFAWSNTIGYFVLALGYASYLFVRPLTANGIAKN